MAVSSFNKDDLLTSVRRGNWSTVIELYKKHPAESQAVEIPKSGDTALHIAVANGVEYAVERLVSVCREEALAIGNERGDTPLHVAAQYGSPRMCQYIAEKNSNLIGSCNQDGETPLFAAVSRGRLGSFIRLNRICEQNQHQYAYLKRKNGDTILHSAISQEHFKIAFYIIKDHPKLVHVVNEDGISPLHLLATKPSCFESGTHLFGLRKLIYHRISVSELQISDDNDDDDDDAALFLANLVQKWYFSCIISLDAAIDRLKASRTENDQRDEEAPDDQGNQTRFKATEPEPSIFRNPCLGWCRPFCLFCAKCCFCLSMCISLLIFGVHLLKYLITEYATASVRNVKQRCVWSVQVMNELLSGNAYEQPEMRPSPETTTTDGNQHLADISSTATTQMETPLLLAAKNGLLEMVEAILRKYSDAIFEVNSDKKNIVMLAVENRHLPLYKFLLENLTIIKTIFGQVDEEGNSVLHIAAKLRKVNQDGNTASALPYRQPWHIPGAALQMHMEVKWYKFVKHSMPRDFFVRHNHKHQTPGQIFRETHQKLIEDGREWLCKNAQSCSVVAALIATVAFATSANVPGGLNQDKGTTTLEHKPIFIISAVASLVALCFSMLSVIMFLGILNSSFKHKDFRKDLPRKLLFGLISLLVSIVSMLLSFFAGHYTS